MGGGVGGVEGKRTTLGSWVPRSWTGYWPSLETPNQDVDTAEKEIKFSVCPYHQCL